MNGIDLLHREEFIGKVIRLIELIAENKAHRSFAIDGGWGSGKTWVLKEIEKEFNQKKESSFLIVYYNCWEYDFYQEPLVAIVSALLDFVETTKILPSRTKGAIKKQLKKVADRLLEAGSALVKPYIGIDLKDMVNGVTDALASANQEEQEKYAFDNFYNFKKTLRLLKDTLSKLSNVYTIVLCVDELDRCLPEYAIKVLERLHHVFDGVENLQLVLSIDKKQLEKTVKTIFGESVNVSGYLQKFIDFTISLPVGDLNQEKFEELYIDYMQEFQCFPICDVQCEQAFLQNIFSKISIRQRIKIIEKAKLVHSMMPRRKEKLTMDYMVVELFLSMASFIYEDIGQYFRKEVRAFSAVIDNKDEKQKDFWILHEKVFSEKNSRQEKRYLPPNNNREVHSFDVTDGWGLLYVVLLHQFEFVNFPYYFTASDNLRKNYASQIIAYGEEFGAILKFIS